MSGPSYCLTRTFLCVLRRVLRSFVGVAFKRLEPSAQTLQRYQLPDYFKNPRRYYHTPTGCGGVRCSKVMLLVKKDRRDNLINSKETCCYVCLKRTLSL